MHREAFVIEQLKAAGHRITLARRHIAEVLEANTRPLSAQDVHALLKRRGVESNRTTVYRELTFLHERGFLRQIQLEDGTARFELASLPHHHHLVCLRCNKIEDIHMEDDLVAVEKRIKKQCRFTVERHSLEFYGRCSSCR